MIFRFKVAGNRIRFFDIIGKVIPGIRVIISKRSSTIYYSPNTQYLQHVRASLIII